MADPLTKPGDRNKLDEDVRKVGGIFEEGRHALAPATENASVESMPRGGIHEEEGAEE